VRPPKIIHSQSVAEASSYSLTIDPLNPSQLICDRWEQSRLLAECVAEPRAPPNDSIAEPGEIGVNRSKSLVAVRALALMSWNRLRLVLAPRSMVWKKPPLAGSSALTGCDFVPHT
jgi:hypothetical protein